MYPGMRIFKSRSEFNKKHPHLNFFQWPSNMKNIVLAFMILEPHFWLNFSSFWQAILITVHWKWNKLTLRWWPTQSSSSRAIISGITPSYCSILTDFLLFVPMAYVENWSGEGTVTVILVECSFSYFHITSSLSVKMLLIGFSLFSYI